MRYLIYSIFILVLIVGCKKESPYIEKYCHDNVVLNTQYQVDSFGKLGYTNLTGYLTIGYQITPESSIKNVDALSDLRVANFVWIKENDSLKNLNGLSNLKEVDAQLIISENPELRNLNGLQNLKEVGAILEISHNDALLDIDGLSNFQSINFGYVEIIGNDRLKNVDGLSNLEHGGWMSIGYNQDLDNISGLSKMKEATYLDLCNNPKLTNLNGLCRLSSVTNGIRIYENINLGDFCGLKKLMKKAPPSYDDYLVDLNLYNPNQNEIENGNCK